jgi:transcriptional regulator with XRE-family HTH domain
MAQKTKTEMLEVYEENNLGLPYSIFIKNTAIAKIDIKTNDVIGVKIPDFDGFVANFIMLRIIVANKIMAEEVRFFRKSLKLTGKKFAELLNVTPETVSRWESGKNIGEKDERIMRVLLGSIFSEKAPQVKFDPKRILQIGLKSRFEINYQPNFCFEQVHVVVDSEGEWRGRQAA